MKQRNEVFWPFWEETCADKILELICLTSSYACPFLPSPGASRSGGGGRQQQDFHSNQSQHPPNHKLGKLASSKQLSSLFLYTPFCLAGFMVLSGLLSSCLKGPNKAQVLIVSSLQTLSFLPQVLSKFTLVFLLQCLFVETYLCPCGCQLRLSSVQMSKA